VVDAGNFIAEKCVVANAIKIMVVRSLQRPQKYVYIEATIVVLYILVYYIYIYIINPDRLQSQNAVATAVSKCRWLH